METRNLTNEQIDLIRKIMVEAGFEELTAGSNLAEFTNNLYSNFIQSVPLIVSLLSRTNFSDEAEQSTVKEFCRGLGDVIRTLYDLQASCEQMALIDVFLNQLATTRK